MGSVSEMSPRIIACRNASACRALAVGVDCLAIDRCSCSRPARIAVLSWGGESKHEHRAHYAQSAATPALAPGAQARQTGNKAGLNFLSFAVKRATICFVDRGETSDSKRQQPGRVYG